MSPAGLADPPAPGVAGAAGAPGSLAPAIPEGAPFARGLAGGLARILSSHVVLVVTGIATMPVLARNLGPAGYGAFSLFVTVLGLVSNLDVARPILVREYTRERERPAALLSLASANAWFLALAAGLAGLLVLGPLAALALALAAFAHGRASRAFAELSIAGRVAAAASARNHAWTLAAVAVAGLSFVAPGPHAFLWPFLGANLALASVYACMAARAGASAAAAPLLPGLRRLFREVWPRHRREVLDLLGFSLASGLVVSADRILLQRSAPDAVAGRYIAHSDLAVKMNAGGTVLGQVLYPLFAREVHERGLAGAAPRFVRIAGWAACAWFAALLALMLLDRQVVGLVLGEAFLAERWVYVLTLVGLFVHMWGFLLTPWQRARGDFAAQRRAYNVAAVLMVATGAVLVPLLGIAGALIAYFAARTAEVLLVAHELASLPSGSVPRWKLAAAAGMLAALCGVAAVKISAMGGAA